MYFQNSERKKHNWPTLKVSTSTKWITCSEMPPLSGSTWNGRWDQIQVSFLCPLYVLKLPSLLCKITNQCHSFSAWAVSGSRGTKADGSSWLGARGNRRDTERQRKQYRGRNFYLFWLIWNFDHNYCKGPYCEWRGSQGEDYCQKNRCEL